MKRAVQVTLVCVIVALAAAAVASLASLRHQVTDAERQISQLQQEQNALRSAEFRMSDQLSSLNVPTDPLAAYDQICQVQLTNSATGVNQTYYYPCTNSAQTIPQPGN